MAEVNQCCIGSSAADRLCPSGRIPRTPHLRSPCDRRRDLDCKSLHEYWRSRRLNHLVTETEIDGAMSIVAFDAVITLHKWHLVAAGLSGRETDAVAAVQSAVEPMDGACAIDVATYPFPIQSADWVVLFPRGQSRRLQTRRSRTLQRKVEEVALAALASVGPPYWQQNWQRMRQA